MYSRLVSKMTQYMWRFDTKRTRRTCAESEWTEPARMARLVRNKILTSY